MSDLYVRPATIVDWLDANKPLPSGVPLALSEPTKTWIDRMWHLIILRTSDTDIHELDELFETYLKGLEAQELLLTLAVFTLLLDLLVDPDLAKCRRCGSILCPHCGKHRKAAPAA
jgi:hypothetical protein